MSPTDQATTLYLTQFQKALLRHRVPNAEEISTDLRNHVLEATDSGKPITDVIAALGSPDQLARAYAMELLLSPPENTRMAGGIRILKVLSLVVAGGFLSLCVVATLGFLGLSLVVAGPAMVVGGILRWMGAHPSWVTPGPLSPVEVMLLGIVVFAIGCSACWLLWGYVRVTARTIRKLLPAPHL